MDSKNKSNGKERAKMQKERRQKIREAKNYQKNRKKSQDIKQNGSSKNTGSLKNDNFKENSARRVSLPKDVYNDSFYTDETKERREKARREKHARQKKQKTPLTPHRRKVRRVVTYCLIFAVILTIGTVLCMTVLFKTEKINVQGNTLYDESKIVQLSGVNLEENIFLSKIKSTPQKIVDALPYIEEARVDFRIPDTINITVKNAEAAYVIISGGQFYKISASGRILELSDDNIDNLPIILCSELSNTEVGKYVEFADEKTNTLIKEIDDCITENGFDNINYVDVRDMSDISMVYDERIKIIIGLPENIPYKLKTAMTIINEKLDVNGSANPSGTLDVSQCKNTKKSYFKDGEISLDITMPQPTTQPVTTIPETTAPTEAPSSEPDYYGGDYQWTPSDDTNTGSADSSVDLSEWGWYDENGNYYDGNGNLVP